MAGRRGFSLLRPGQKNGPASDCRRRKTGVGLRGKARGQQGKAEWRRTSSSDSFASRVRQFLEARPMSAPPLGRLNGGRTELVRRRCLEMKKCRHTIAEYDGLIRTVASLPPGRDEWTDVGISDLGGDVTIRAVAKKGEPHFISVSVQGSGGNVRIRRVCCCPQHHAASAPCNRGRNEALLKRFRAIQG